MEMRTMSPGAGWSWLWEGVSSVFRRPGTLIGAAALMLLVPVGLGLVQAGSLLLAGGSPGIVQWVNGLAMLLVAVLFPLFCGGYLRIVDAIRHDRHVSAWDIFALFQPGSGGTRVVLVGLGFFLLTMLFMALIFFTVGHGVGTWYMQLMSATAKGAATSSAAPEFPDDGFALAVALLTVYFIFYSAAFAIGMGQAALRERPVMAAIRDGIVGAVKNVLPLLVLTICGLVAYLVFAVGGGVVVVMLGVLVVMVSPALAALLVIPLYAVMMMVIYTVMFGVMYALWQDVAGADQAPSGEAARLEL